MGRSPNHGRNVSLILDRQTGLVSPQFHVAFDPSFRTVKQDQFDSLWQVKAGLVTNERNDVPKKAKKSKKTEAAKKGQRGPRSPIKMISPVKMMKKVFSRGKGLNEAPLVAPS